MKEIKETIEKVVGYAANDGTYFTDMQECIKYEKSAKYAITTAMNGIILERYCECEIFENFGYGSEEYTYWLIEIKNENDLKVANQYAHYVQSKIEFTSDDIGKRLLVAVGYAYDGEGLYTKTTYDDLVKLFVNQMRNRFKLEKEGD